MKQKQGMIVIVIVITMNVIWILMSDTQMTTMMRIKMSGMKMSRIGSRVQIWKICVVYDDHDHDDHVHLMMNALLWRIYDTLYQKLKK
jgi:hypothetical protein